MSAFKADFKSRELDPFFERWLAGEISTSERAEWMRILSYDNRFREEFCDWIKSMRELGWARGSHKKNSKGESK